MTLVHGVDWEPQSCTTPLKGVCKRSVLSHDMQWLQVHDFLSQPIFEDFPDSTFIEVGSDAPCRG